MSFRCSDAKKTTSKLNDKAATQRSKGKKVLSICGALWLTVLHLMTQNVFMSQVKIITIV